MKLKLLDLPTELLHRCLHFLDGLDLLKCRRINRLFKSIIKQSTALQYAIELFAACAEDNPLYYLPVSEKLQRLRQRQDAWFGFIRHRIISVDVKHIPSGIYDFTSGVYILGEAPQDMSRITKGLKYICLPSLDDLHDDAEVRVPWRSIETTDLVVDLGMAVQEHDLVAVVTQRTVSLHPMYTRDIFIEFIQFSTGKPHPSASKPMFTVLHNVEALGHASIGIEIVGDLLVLLLTFPFSPITEDRLFVYSWKTATRSIVHTAHSGTYTSFTFISPTAIVMVNNHTAVLELFDLSSPEKRLVPVWLSLPALRPECCIARTACRGEPNPAPSGLSHRTGQPFHDKAEDAIIIFNILLQQQPLANPLVAVSLITHRSSLLEWFEEGCQKNETLVVPWARWGPRVTRWFDANDVVTRWVTTTCGQRSASVADAGPSRISVMDFNRYKVKKMMDGKRKLPAGTGIPASTVLDAIEGREKRRMGDCGPFGISVDNWAWEREHYHLGFTPYEEEAEGWEYEEDKERVKMDMVPIEITQDATVWLNCFETYLSDDLGVFENPVESRLPYIETVSRRSYSYDAVLIDEERIIGMHMDEMNERVHNIDIIYMG